MKILKVIKSDRKNKKLKALLDNGKEVHFGSDVSQTYVEGASKEKRDNYLKRHLANPIEKRLIQNNVMSPSLLSYELLWRTPSLKKNIEILNKKL
jgi:hypothetical protein